jgi:hypothetical protein
MRGWSGGRPFVGRCYRRGLEWHPRTRASGAPRDPGLRETQTLQRTRRGCPSLGSGCFHVELERARDWFVAFSFLSIVPVMAVVEVVADGREGVADCASDQGAEASSDQGSCHATARGLIPGGGRPESCAGAEADQNSEWREGGWTRRKRRGIGSSARRWHRSTSSSREPSLSDQFIFGGLLHGRVCSLGCRSLGYLHAGRC